MFLQDPSEHGLAPPLLVFSLSSFFVLVPRVLVSHLVDDSWDRGVSKYALTDRILVESNGVLNQ